MLNVAYIVGNDNLNNSIISNDKEMTEQLETQQVALTFSHSNLAENFQTWTSNFIA